MKSKPSVLIMLTVFTLLIFASATAGAGIISALS